MLLAEALALRADRQKRLDELTERIQENARVTEGQLPDEDPRELIAAATATVAELNDLVKRINRTNAGTVGDAESGASVSDLIAERDHAKRMVQLHRSVAQAGTRGAGRGWLSRDREGVTHAAVDVAMLQKEADRWAERYRAIDVRLQQLNWATELVG